MRNTLEPVLGPRLHTEDKPIAVGSIRFFDSTVPALLDRDYLMTITSSVTSQQIDAKSLSALPIASQHFSLSGPRFGLSAQDVYSLYPAPQSQGEYDTHLPHLVLSKPATPWERAAQEGSAVPWVALLVFSGEDELEPLPGKVRETLDQDGCISATVADFKKWVADAMIPQLTLSAAEATQSCRFIRLSLALFQQIAPRSTLDSPEVALLTHVRQVNAKDKQDLGMMEQGWFSVVMANRFPLANSKNRVHLVSLEGYESFLTDQPPKLEPTQTHIHLISLTSWSFQCNPARVSNSTDLRKESFADLFKKILTHLPTDHVPLLRCLPPDQEVSELPPSVRNHLSNGYLPLPYSTRTGEKTLAWYRGPFSPGAVEARKWLPETVRSGESLMLYDQEFGVFNQTYAVAWQIGRSMALADQTFSQQLIEFRRQSWHHLDETLYREWLAENTTTLVKKDEKPAKVLMQHFNHIHQLTAGHFPEEKKVSSILKPLIRSRPGRLTVSQRRDLRRDFLQTRAGDILSVTDAIKNWCKNSRQLQGLPFQYLVADEKLLPAESIRFFHIDQNWLDVLIKGALTIGMHTVEDEKLNTSIVSALKMDWKTQSPVCGLLLRSVAVSNWPELGVRAYSDEKDSGSLFAAARQEKLSSEVLLCLFNQIPARICICEPQEQMGFGVTGDNLDEGLIAIRNVTDSIGKIISDENSLKITDYLRDAQHRVLDIKRLALALNGILKQPTISPWMLAVELIRAPEEIQFSLQQQASNRRFATRRALNQPGRLVSPTHSKKSSLLPVSRHQHLVYSRFLGVLNSLRIGVHLGLLGSMATGLITDEFMDIKSVAVVEAAYIGLSSAGLLARCAHTTPSPKSKRRISNGAGWLLVIITSLLASVFIFTDEKSDALLTKIGLLLAACSILLANHGVGAEINGYSFFPPCRKKCHRTQEHSSAPEIKLSNGRS